MQKDKKEDKIQTTEKQSVVPRNINEKLTSIKYRNDRISTGESNGNGSIKNKLSNIDTKKMGCDVVLRKVFDMKMKAGHEVQSSMIDESSYLKTFFFLKSHKIYSVDIASKAHNEYEPMKGKDVIYMSGSQCNKYMVAATNSGMIYIISLKDPTKIKVIKNFLFNSLMFDLKKICMDLGVNQTYNSIFNSNTGGIPINLINTQNNTGGNTLSRYVTNWVESLNITVSSSLNKVVVFNSQFLSIWNATKLFESIKNKGQSGTSTNTVSESRAQSNAIPQKKSLLKSNSLTGLFNLGSKDNSKALKSDRSNSSTGSRQIKEKDEVQELNGTFYTVSLETERESIGVKDKSTIYFDSICYIFANTYYYGSHLKVTYIVLSLYEQSLPFESQTKASKAIAYKKGSSSKESAFQSSQSNPNLWRICFVDFIFQFDLKEFSSSSKLENLYKITKKVCFFPVEYSCNKEKDSKDGSGSKSRLISRFNNSSSQIAVAINSESNFHSRLLLYMQETSKITSFPLLNIFKTEQDTNSNDDFKKMWVEDLCFICNDSIMLVQFSAGFFALFTLNFEILSFIDSSKSLSCLNPEIPVIWSCPSYFTGNRELSQQRFIRLINSYGKEDYFLITSGLYSICFQTNFLNFKSKIQQKGKINSLNLFFTNILNYQVITTISTSTLNYSTDSAVNVFSGLKEQEILERIHNYMMDIFQEYTYQPEPDPSGCQRMTSIQSRTANKQVFFIYSLFIKLYRSVNVYHESSLSLISYLFGITNDFFYYLITIRQFHLALMLINHSEQYLLKPLNLKQTKFGIHARLETKGINASTQSTMNSSSYISQYVIPTMNPSFNIFNTHPIVSDSNSSIFRKLNNRHIQCKLRLLLIICNIIEYRYEPEDSSKELEDIESYSDQEDTTLEAQQDNDKSEVPQDETHNTAIPQNNIKEINTNTLNSSKYSNSKAQNELLNLQQKMVARFSNVPKQDSGVVKETKKKDQSKKQTPFDLMIRRKKQKFSYFLVAYQSIQELKKLKYLDDIQSVVKALVRNYKYLKAENSRAGGEEFVLNGMTLNPRTDLLSYLLHNRVPREDINFNFFSSFFPLDELQNFNEHTEMYCAGRERKLIESYQYLNNTGKLMTWILMLKSKMFSELFSDVKTYYVNFSKQQKEKTNFEIDNLINFVNFNFVAFVLNLLLILKQYLLIEHSSFTYSTTLSSHLILSSGISSSTFCSGSKSNSVCSFGVRGALASSASFMKHENNASHFENNSSGSMLKVSLLSPVDIPFLVFDYYIQTDNNKNKTLLPWEYSAYLYSKIELLSKSSNLNYYDLLSFIDFIDEKLVGESFQDELNFDEPIPPIKRRIVASFICYYFFILKLGMVHMLDTNFSLVTTILDESDLRIKRILTEYMFVILNGLLRYYLNLESSNKLSDNDSKYLEVVLFQIKSMFYKTVREDPFEIKIHIPQFVFISPGVMKPYLAEGALFYEYKSLNMLLKPALFSTSRLSDVLLTIEKEQLSSLSEPIKCVLNSTKSIVKMSPDCINIFKFLFLDQPYETSKEQQDKEALNVGQELSLSSIDKKSQLLSKLSSRVMSQINSSERVASTSQNSQPSSITFSGLQDINSKFLMAIIGGPKRKDIPSDTLQHKIKNIKSTIKNIVELIKISNLITSGQQPPNSGEDSNSKSQDKQSSNQKLIFSIETSVDYIRKLLINNLIEKSKDLTDLEFLDKFNSVIDKIIKGNFDAKNLFKFSNQEIKTKLIHSMKSILAKFCHLLVSLKLQFLLETSKDYLFRLSIITLLAIVDEKYASISVVLKVIDFIKVQTASFFRTQDSMRILININYIMLFVNKSLVFPEDFDSFLARDCGSFYQKYNEFIKNEFSKIKLLYAKLNENIKYKNIKHFLLLMFNDFYFEILNDVYSDLKDFILASESNSDLNFYAINRTHLREIQSKSQKQNNGNLWEARQLFVSVAQKFEKLSGIDFHKFIEFETNWTLKSNKLLFSQIITDDLEKISSFNEHSRRQNLIMNRRQQTGVDTPKKPKNSGQIHIKSSNLKSKKEPGLNSEVIITDTGVETESLNSKSRNTSSDIQNNYDTDDLISNKEKISSIDPNDEEQKRGVNKVVLKIQKKNTMKVPKYSRNKQSTSQTGVTNPKVASPHNLPVASNTFEPKLGSFLSVSSNEQYNSADSNGLADFYIVLEEKIETCLKRFYFNVLNEHCFNIFKENKMNEELDSIKILKITTSNTLKDAPQNLGTQGSMKYSTNSNTIISIKEVELKEKYKQSNIYLEGDKKVIDPKIIQNNSSKPPVNEAKPKINQIKYLTRNPSNASKTISESSSIDLKVAQKIPTGKQNLLTGGGTMKEKGQMSQIKPFELININKYKPGAGGKSNILTDIKSGEKNIQNVIKSKIEEIQNKLNKFESIAKNLAKEFEEEGK